MNNPAWQEAVIAIAHEASRRIMAIYAQDFRVEWKSDASPLTAADLAAHDYISTQLAALTPDIPVLSEESATIPAAERLRWRRLWLVDPLDGTREFVKKNGEFSVNIALIEEGVATWGVIVQPLNGFIHYGGAGHGAWQRPHPQGVSTPMQPRRPATAPLMLAASRSHGDGGEGDALRARMAALPVFAGAHTRRLGSSLKFCHLAAGQLDVYPRLGPTGEWDTAAGQAIVEGAGGAVLALDGRPFRYNQRDTLLNGSFIAAADPALLTALLA